ncbi:MULTISPECIES: hypothetical protein [Pseudomonas]|jgi:hypothetical protein|uniref:hypothetical protein n=1 Tax=Pseudomonas TaxID=286 RepID=UPI000A1D7A7B|nr:MULTISPECIES: hypothetical protein [Pseudomonas]MCH4901975.1 hypothetical protein [Pseudomonas sp. B707]PNB46881.1 hypothetical protein C1X29_25875 [Pseudomonas sp. GW456-12-10-14-LB2]TEA63839.1 hypothetical protein EIY71_01790 [Pseudomonas sp. CH235]
MSAKKSIGTFALPLTIEGVGADKVLPLDAHINGVTLRMSPWVAPSIIPGKSDLLEIWILEPGAISETRFYNNLFPVPVVFPGTIHLPAQYLQQTGDITLRYRVTSGDTSNEDDSIPQVFILKRPVPVKLKEVVYPDANLWGWLMCLTFPAIWDVVVVRVPAQPGTFLANDECVLNWEGCTSLNGVNPIPGTALRIRKTLSQQEATSPQGFDFRLDSSYYVQYIKPIEFGSAMCTYTHYRNGVALASSYPEFVKIDRRLSGKPPCGP